MRDEMHKLKSLRRGRKGTFVPDRQKMDTSIETEDDNRYIESKSKSPDLLRRPADLEVPDVPPSERAQRKHFG